MSFERSAPVHPKRHGRSVVLARATADLGDKAGDVSEQTGAERFLQKVKGFRSVVWSYWEREGRHGLPWRKTRDPYRILVSEVMLQQTQVDRVVPKYHEFLKAFPNVRALVDAPLARALRVWSGLGYNRRAKYLHDAAKMIVEKFDGNIPHDYVSLRALPGIGDYTAKAVRVFAFNESEAPVETNIRTVFIHHAKIWTRRVHILDKVADADVARVAMEAAEGQDPRTWYWALMDYGAHLKRTGVRTNHRSAHYAKQSKFKGSLRQVRGAILKAHTTKTSLESVRRQYPDRFKRALASLARDGLLEAE